MIRALLALFMIGSGTAHAGDIHVIDGDGFMLGDREIRIWGIDAPELTQECDNSSGGPYACGKASKAFLSEILAVSAPICETVDVDRYGRDISRCAIDGADIGGAMVRAGWAVDYTRFSDGVYLADQNEAQKNSRGLWSGTFHMPWDWRSLSR